MSSFGYNAIVVGASAGGLSALKALVKLRPHPLRTTLFVAWHIASQSHGDYVKILSDAGRTPFTLARDGSPIFAGSIYIAPPGCHLTILNGHLQVTAGPKERNLFRPSVDRLFHSAADTYGSQVIGIVLGGSLDDRTDGLAAIHARRHDDRAGPE